MPIEQEVRDKILYRNAHQLLKLATGAPPRS
jgi:predicted TIM-barrel fold metal-dependent hydrolase